MLGHQDALLKIASSRKSSRKRGEAEKKALCTASILHSASDRKRGTESHDEGKTSSNSGISREGKSNSVSKQGRESKQGGNADYWDASSRHSSCRRSRGSRSRSSHDNSRSLGSRSLGSRSRGGNSLVSDGSKSRGGEKADARSSFAAVGTRRVVGRPQAALFRSPLGGRYGPQSKQPSQAKRHRSRPPKAL